MSIGSVADADASTLAAITFFVSSTSLVKPVTSEFGLYILIKVFRCHKISIATL
jgi:hypothetical protein